MGPPPAGGGGGGGLPPWLLPALGGVIAVFVVAIVVLLVTGDDDDGDTDLVGGSGGGTEQTDDTGTGGTDDGGEEEAAGPEHGGVEDPQYDPQRLTGTWEGTYDCGDGDTDLVLTVDDYPDEPGVGANWWFNPDSDDEGMYHMEGTYEGGQLSLEATAWEQHFTDLEGEQDMYDLEADLSGFTGTEPMEVTASGDDCGDFTLERTSQDPWYVGTFEGQYLCAQGLTGATVTIEPTGQDTAYAFWEFYDIGEADYEVPYGSMHKDAVYSDRSLRLTLNEWERQPEGYIAIDVVSNPETDTHPNRFHGYLDDQPLIDEGVIQDAECGLIGLTRVEEAETADAAEEEAADGAGTADEE